MIIYYFENALFQTKLDEKVHLGGISISYKIECKYDHKYCIVKQQIDSPSLSYIIASDVVANLKHTSYIS